MSFKLTDELYICPACGRGKFRRVKDENGNLLPPEYGICWFQRSCGYVKRPEKK
ncbi:MAG: hypothetical protein JXC36_02795 [Candidatus Atribacteria bacterium]|nr:hypothetical protein [Candidatus Atribacteria bacterium]